MRLRLQRILIALALFAPTLVIAPTASAQQGSMVISEIHYNPDGQSEGEEFVKLTNNSNLAIDISGWYFSAGLDFIVPAATPLVAPGAHFVIAKDAGAFAAVFGSAPNGVFANGSTLSNSGEALTLRNLAAGLVDTVTYDDLAPWPTAADGGGKSLQLYDLNLDNALASSWVVGSPSPGGANMPDLTVIFSVERGWYNGNQQVTLTPSIPGATIKYRIDNAVLDLGSGTAGWTDTSLPGQQIDLPATAALADVSLPTTYTGPITVVDNNTMVGIRAQATLGGSSGRVIAHSYVFFPDTGVPILNFWGAGESPDASEGDHASGLIEFVPPPSTGLAAEAEYAGVKRNISENVLGYGRHSERIYFRNSYGAGRWDVDLFGDNFYGTDGQFFPEPSIDQLYLRNGHHDVTMIKQMIAQDTMLEMGQLAPHGRIVDFFINGGDEGPRHLQERPESGFMSEYLGGDKQDWIAGPWDSFHPSQISSSASDFAAFDQQVNTEQLVDYLIIQWGSSCDDYDRDDREADFPYNKNWRWGGPVTGTGDGGDRRALFYNWDMDHSLGSNVRGWNPPVGLDGKPVTQIGTGFHYECYGVAPGEYWDHPYDSAPELDDLPAAVDLFENRIQCHLLDDGGPMTAAARYDVFNQRRLEVLASNTITDGGGTHPTTGIYDGHITHLTNWWANQQSNNWVQDQIDLDMAWYRANGLFPQDLDAVRLVVSGSTLVVTNPNSAQGHDQVWYTLDGSDPRLTDGSLSPTAIRFVSGVALPAGRTEVIARTFDTATGEFGPACNEPKVIDVAVGSNEPAPVINEIHYNPASDGSGTDPQLREWIEIHNPATTDYAMSSVTFSDGISFTFPNVTIPAGGYYVIADDAAAFTAEYGFAPDAEFGGNLDNGGELLKLLTASGATMDQVTYNDIAPWPTAPDGTGPSLTLIDPLSNNALAASWDASGSDGGTPGAVNDTAWILGDVRCDGAVDITDAHHTMLYVLNAKQAHNGCPLPPGGNHINVDVADVDSNGSIEPPDALFIAQCTLGAINVLCP